MLYIIYIISLFPIFISKDSIFLQDGIL